MCPAMSRWVSGSCSSLISAFGVIGQGPQAGGGVAFMANIGGFIAGAILVKLFAVKRRSAALGLG